MTHLSIYNIVLYLYYNATVHDIIMTHLSIYNIVLYLYYNATVHDI